MRDPFHPERELLTAEEASQQRADLDQRWEALETGGFYANGGDRKYQELVFDEFFAPWEVSCPNLAQLIRRQSA